MHLIDILFPVAAVCGNFVPCFISVTIHPYAKSCGELQIIGIGNDTFALDTGNGTELVACGEPSKSLVIELTEMHKYSLLFLIS